MQRVFFSLLHVVFLRSWYVRRALRDAVPRDGSPIRMLDAGTGFGQYAWHVLRRYPHVRVHAVDVKAEYLDNLGRFVATTGRADRLTLAVEDLTRLESEGPFDVILSVDVMEHIEDDRAVFRNFRALAAPGCRVLINTPSDQGGSGVTSEGGASFIGEHVRDGYGADELCTKLRDAGLEIESVTFTYGPAGSLAWRLLLQVPMLLLAKGFWTLPLVALWYVPAFPMGMILNAVDVLGVNRRGTGLLVVARRP